MPPGSSEFSCRCTKGQAGLRGMAMGARWRHRLWAFSQPSCPYSSPDSPGRPEPSGSGGLTTKCLTCCGLQVCGPLTGERFGPHEAPAAARCELWLALVFLWAVQTPGGKASPLRVLAVSSHSPPHLGHPFVRLSAAFLHFVGFSHFPHFSHEETESQKD